MHDELGRMYAADRHEHAQGHAMGTVEYVTMRERDRQRRQRITEMIDAHELSTAADYLHAAQIFQHGDTPEDARTAHELAVTATHLGEPRARWMAAAAYDRWQMYQSKPQKYGTQYVTDGKRHRLWDWDETTTDADRMEWDVPPLAEQLRKAEEATRLDPPKPVGVDAPTWLRTAIARWEKDEHPDGDGSGNRS